MDTVKTELDRTSRCTSARTGRWLCWTLLLALILGVLAGLWIIPRWQMHALTRQVLSNDPAIREPAVWRLRRMVQTWNAEWAPETGSITSAGDSNPVVCPRTGALGRSLMQALRSSQPPTAQVTAEAFSDAVSLIRQCQQWNPETAPLDLWLRHCEILAGMNAATGSPGPDAAAMALDQLIAISLSDERSHGSDYEERIRALWQRLITLHAEYQDGADAKHLLAISHNALIQAARRYGPASIMPLVESTLNDPSTLLQRSAWLLLAAANPQEGFTVNLSEKPIDVTEAILWAAVTTNPDQAAPLLTAAVSSSELESVIPYLLARSTDPQAAARLGDPARIDRDDIVIALALAAGRASDTRRGIIEPDTRTAITLLYAGIKTAYAPPGPEWPANEPILRRWSAWTDAQNLSGQVDDPAAADGSVWAAVLLAERCLDAAGSAEIASHWMHDLNDDVKRAGLLLAGLTGQHEAEIARVMQASPTVRVRRAARLAMLMAHPEDSDNTDACRRIVAAETGSPGLENDALLALLAAGDMTAVEQLLKPRPNLSSSQRLLMAAWLVERFCPHLKDSAQPLIFRSERMAALQLDAMLWHWRLSRSLMRFNAETRQFEISR